MLAGNAAVIWEGISGSEVLAITMQAPEPVDDVVVELRGAENYSLRSRNEGVPSRSVKAVQRSSTRLRLLSGSFTNRTGKPRLACGLVWAVPGSAGVPVNASLGWSAQCSS